MNTLKEDPLWKTYVSGWYYRNIITLDYCYRHNAGERDENQLCIDNLQDVFSLLINAEKCWFYLGLALHIKPGTLESIKSKESCNTDRLCEMLTHWLQFSSSRTWSDICNGLRSETVKQNALADTIEDKHKQGIDNYLLHAIPFL